MADLTDWLAVVLSTIAVLVSAGTFWLTLYNARFSRTMDLLTKFYHHSHPIYKLCLFSVVEEWQDLTVELNGSPIGVNSIGHFTSAIDRKRIRALFDDCAAILWLVNDQVGRGLLNPKIMEVPVAGLVVFLLGHDEMQGTGNGLFPRIRDNYVRSLEELLVHILGNAQALPQVRRLRRLRRQAPQPG